MKVSIPVLISGALALSSCSTLNESLQLGATMGALSGAGASYAAHSSTGEKASFENVALGAGIGLGIGLITSYVVHKNVEEKRQSSNSNETEMHFGDLPPSPFIMPPGFKKGGK